MNYVRQIMLMTKTPEKRKQLNARQRMAVVGETVMMMIMMMMKRTTVEERKKRNGVDDIVKDSVEVVAKKAKAWRYLIVVLF